MEVGEAVEPLSVITHIGMSSFYPIDRLGKEIEGGPFIVSVGKDRDVRINYFIPPESEDDDFNDDEEEEESKITKKLGSSRKESPVKKQSNTKNQKLNDSMSINSDDQELAIGIKRILPGYDRDGHEGHRDKILEVRVVFIKGVTYIITSSEDLMVKRFDATDEKLLKVKTYKGCHKEFINCLDVIPEWQDCNYILSGSYDGLLCLWNWDNTEVPLIKYQHTKKLFCMYRFQDIVVTGCGMEIWVWNVFKGDIKYKITTKHSRPVTSITVVKGDYDIRMISASDDRTICIFNLINGTLIHKMTTETPIYALTGYYNDDIPMFIIGNFGGDNAVLLYDLKTFKLINRIVGHSDKVTNVNVWLQGKSARLTTSSWDNTIRTYDLQIEIRKQMRRIN